MRPHLCNECARPVSGASLYCSDKCLRLAARRVSISIGEDEAISRFAARAAWFRKFFEVNYEILVPVVFVFILIGALVGIPFAITACTEVCSWCGESFPPPAGGGYEVEVGVDGRLEVDRDRWICEKCVDIQRRTIVEPPALAGVADENR